MAWERIDESAGHSVARVQRLPWGWRCHGMEVLAGPRELLSCWFRVDLDDSWVTREVVVGAVAENAKASPGESPPDRSRRRTATFASMTWSCSARRAPRGTWNRSPAGAGRPAPTEEELLVLYLGRPADPALLQRLVHARGRIVPARNPYWDRWGITIAGPDGYRLVLSDRTWP